MAPHRPTKDRRGRPRLRAVRGPRARYVAGGARLRPLWGARRGRERASRVSGAGVGLGARRNRRRCKIFFRRVIQLLPMLGSVGLASLAQRTRLMIQKRKTTSGETD